jgi:hypothetical protein
MSTPKNIQGANGNVLFFDRVMCSAVIVPYASANAIKIQERNKFINIYFDQTAGFEKTTGTTMISMKIKRIKINLLLRLSKKTAIGR